MCAGWLFRLNNNPSLRVWWKCVSETFVFKARVFNTYNCNLKGFDWLFWCDDLSINCEELQSIDCWQGRVNFTIRKGPQFILNCVVLVLYWKLIQNDIDWNHWRNVRCTGWSDFLDESHMCPSWWLQTKVWLSCLDDLKAILNSVRRMWYW